MGAPRKATDYEAVLRDAGLRITKPRRIILEILHDTEGHPDADADLRARGGDGQPHLARHGLPHDEGAGGERARSSATPSPAARRGSRGAGGAPRPPDRPRHRRGDRVRLATGSRRCRRRSPPGSATRSSTTGSSSTAARSRRATDERRRLPRSARGEAEQRDRRAGPARPSASVRVSAAAVRSRRSAAEAPASSGSSASQPPGPQVRQGDRHAPARRRCASATPSGRKSGSGVATVEGRRAPASSASRSTSPPSGARDRGRASAGPRRRSRAASRGSRLQPARTRARRAGRRARGGGEQPGSRQVVLFDRTLLSMIALRCSPLASRSSPNVPLTRSKGRRGGTRTRPTPQKSEGRSSVPHARGHP